MAAACAVVSPGPDRLPSGTAAVVTYGPVRRPSGLSWPCPPSPQERDPPARLPQRNALAAHEPAYGLGRLPGEQLDVVQPGPAVPVQVLDEGGAQRDRLGESCPDRAVGGDVRNVMRAENRGDEVVCPELSLATSYSSAMSCGRPGGSAMRRTGRKRPAPRGRSGTPARRSARVTRCRSRPVSSPIL